jgi:hypothetical protein
MASVSPIAKTIHKCLVTMQTIPDDFHFLELTMAVKKSPIQRLVITVVWCTQHKSFHITWDPCVLERICHLLHDTYPKHGAYYDQLEDWLTDHKDVTRPAIALYRLKQTALACKARVITVRKLDANGDAIVYDTGLHGSWATDIDRAVLKPRKTFASLAAAEKIMVLEVLCELYGKTEAMIRILKYFDRVLEVEEESDMLCFHARKIITQAWQKTVAINTLYGVLLKCPVTVFADCMKGICPKTCHAMLASEPTKPLFSDNYKVCWSGGNKYVVSD